MPFQTGNSTSKGRVFSEGYYQTLGKSADLRIYGDYFSLRGLAVGGIFRIRPNPETRFSLQAYGTRDKLNQGGIQLIVDGESMLKGDWRAALPYYPATPTPTPPPTENFDVEPMVTHGPYDFRGAGIP